MSRTPPVGIAIRVDPYPADATLRPLLQAAWGTPGVADYSVVLKRSLVHLGAYDGQRLVGFVNVAWDGGEHASIFDLCVDPAFRRRGIATALVNRATAVARERGATWLHVDFEPHLGEFYRACGFAPTEAGLIKLR